MSTGELFALGALGGVLLAGLYALSRCALRVEEGHVAVVTRFGAALREPDGRLRALGPGLHMKQPWDEVHVVATMEQNLDLSGEDGGRMAMAEDGTVLRFDSILRYVPVPRELDAFLFGMRSPMEHITGLFTCLLRNEIANFHTHVGAASKERDEALQQAGSYALIRRERALLNRQIAEFCHTEIGDRYGVHFNAVDLVDILPPDELADALNGMIHARNEAETSYFRAEAECRQRVLAAERGVQIARARALAAETEMLAIASALEALDRAGTLDAYVSRRRAEVLADSRTLYLKERA